MPTLRYDHACGVVTNPQTGGLEVVVAGGAQDYRGSDSEIDTETAVDEVEIFSISDLKWRRAGLFMLSQN